MIHDYLEHLRRRRRSPNTIQLRLSYLGRYERDVGPLIEASFESLDDWIRAHPHWAPKTAACAVESFTGFFHWAVRAGRIDVDPTIDLAAPIIHPRARAVADESRLRAALTIAPVPQRAAMRLGAECGLRAHEIAKARPDEREGEWLHVIGKGGRHRVVPLSPELRAELDQLGGGDYYFPGRDGGHVGTTTVRKWIAPLVGVTPHALRRRAATIVYQASGYDLRLTQEFLGHASPATTARYVQVARHDLHRAASMTRLAA